MVLQQVSFVERPSLSQRVPYRRFHCIGSENTSYYCTQGISPGLVRTEFGPRLEKATDIEQAKKNYDKKVDGVRGTVFFT